MKLNDDNFIMYAAKYYDNPGCHNIVEFEEDLKRFQYVKKLFMRYDQENDLRERLILNHMIILYNCFGLNTTNMLFLRLEGYHHYLKPFISYLNYLPTYIEYNNKIVNSTKIQSDLTIIKRLKEI